MQPHPSRWRFSVAVLLPVVGAVLLTVALAGSFFVWSARRSDDAALVRQQAMASHLLALTKSDFEGAQGTIVLRYEAAEAFLEEQPDMDWIDAEMGWGAYVDFAHERVYVLDADLDPIYAARDGESQDISVYDQDRAIIDPMAMRLQSPEFVAQIAAYEAGDADWPPHISDFAIIDGRPAFVGVLPIVSSWEGQEQVAGTHHIHVAIKFLDTAVAEAMSEDYLLRGARFDISSTTTTDETAIPVANSNGRFVAWFKWVPERPGEALIAETLPASIGVLGVIAFVISLLLYGLARSTAALERARAEALHRATHDPLTGLANRALFAERLESSPLPLSLLALDLDRFKHVNDTLGHEAGDDLLRQVALRLTRNVGDQGLVARLGGDEFMVLVPAADPARLTDLAAGIVQSIAVPFKLGSDTATIGVSVGIATALTDERHDLVSRADFALYDAKESGRNTYRIFEDVRRAA